MRHGFSRARGGVWLLLLLGALASPTALGAQALTGSIAGTVVDSGGGSLPGVTVTLSGPGILGDQIFITTEAGDFRFPAVPPGTYKIATSLPGFATTERGGIVVTVGGATRLQFVMQVATLQETVNVTGVAPTVDVDTTRVAQTFTGEMLKAVPFQRDFWDVLKATPGVTSDNLSYRATTSVSGAGVRQTGYGLDGTNLTDSAASYAGIRNLNFDSFEEIEVITGAMPAEVGGASGGFVNIVTKSGGNDFHGGGSYYYANESLQSALQDSVIAKGIRPGSTGIHMVSDGTVELGGPVRKNKIWFYGSYRRLDNDTVGIGFRREALDLPEDNDVLFGKVTAQPTSAHKVTFTGSYIDRFQPQFTYTVSPLVDRLGNWYLKETGPSYGAQWQWILNQTTYIENRFGTLLKQTYYEIQPDSTEPSTLNLANQELTGSQPRGQHDWRNRYQFNTALSHFRDKMLGGSHDFKVGLDYTYFSHLQSEQSLAGYQRQFTNDAATFVQFANGYPNRIARYKHLYDWGVYAQDRWSVGKRLTMNLGVRFDSVQFVFPEQTFGATGVFPELQSVPIFQPVNAPRTVLADWQNLSPRLGFIFDLTGDGKTPLKVSYSRYNDQVFTYMSDGPMAWRTSLHRWTDNNLNRLVDPGEFGPALSTTGVAGTNDPNAKRPYWNEVIVGVERQLPAHLSVGARFMRRVNKNIFDDVDVGTEGGWFPISVYDPGPDNLRNTADDVGAITAYDLVPELLGKNRFMSINVPGAVRRYRSLDLSANKRMSDKWQMFSSLTLSTTKGNIGNDYGGTAGVTGNFNNPNARINEYGPLGLDSPVQIKMGGNYQLPWSIDVGALYVHNSGYPYTRRVRITTDINGRALNVGNITINAEPLGSERLPAQDVINLNVVKTIKVPHSQELKLMVDVFNVSNQNAILTVNTLSGATFGSVQSIAPPRYARVGVRYRF